MVSCCCFLNSGSDVVCWIVGSLYSVIGDPDSPWHKKLMDVSGCYCRWGTPQEATCLQWVCVQHTFFHDSIDRSLGHPWRSDQMWPDEVFLVHVNQRLTTSAVGTWTWSPTPAFHKSIQGEKHDALARHCPNMLLKYWLKNGKTWWLNMTFLLVHTCAWIIVLNGQHKWFTHD